MSTPDDFDLPPEDDDENWITIEDDDGHVIERISIDLCNHVADQTLVALSEVEEQLEHFDFSTAAFGLFVNCVHILREAGWRTEDLIKEVQDHGDLYDCDQTTIN